VGNLTVGISDAKISTDPDAVLVTHALGSCIGVTIHDPVRKMGGLLHFQLPHSKGHESSSQSNPLKYADTGFDILLDELQSLGAQKSSVEVKMAGGAHKLSTGNDSFNIGKRNYAAIRQTLWKKGMFINAQDIGGDIPRTIYFSIADGTVTIKSQGKTVKTI
jgi:chemotaxis protein CheD